MKRPSSRNHPRKPGIKNKNRLNAPSERIQKILARGGVASRREIERWITEGKIQINGQIATPGAALRPGDKVVVNGRPIYWEKYTQQPTRVLIYNKPFGELVSRNDPQKRPIVFKQLPKLDIGRWIAVGRLDINTSGLLLLTNNGELANRLMHPSAELEREYAVRILGDVPPEMLETLRNGVELEDGPAHFDKVFHSSGEGANKWFHVVVKEGRNRLVRRLWESQGVTVSRLMRVRYGPMTLPPSVRAKKYYELADKERDQLLQMVDLPPEKKTLAPHRRKF